MILIKPLHQTGFDELFAAFSEAFAVYERTWNRKEFEKHLHRRGYMAGISFGAFHKEKLVAFTLNAWGSFNGKQTVYDLGTGTIAEFRGKGLASSILKQSLPVLKQKGAQQYLLEVLHHNTKAVEIYTKTGFQISRELNYFVVERTTLKTEPKDLPQGVRIEPTNRCRKEEMRVMWDHVPSWQNGFEALSGCSEDLLMFGAFKQNELIGYGIVEPESGDIPQLAVKKSERGKGVGTGILYQLISHARHPLLKIMNTNRSSESITRFIEHCGIPLKGYQYEMIMDLNTPPIVTNTKRT